MKINHDGLRIEVARAIYEDSIGGLEGAPPWFKQPKEVQDGFLKFATVCFVTLWKKDPKDLVEFWCSHVWKSLPGCKKQLEEHGNTELLCGDVDNGKKVICNECKMKVLIHEKD